ncbi:hypothetical protein ACWEQ2_44535 [Streptomyces sp. NPDC004096]
MTTAVRTPGYLDGMDAEKFSLDTYLSQFDARLLADPEGRRTLTRLDPLLFGLDYQQLNGPPPPKRWGPIHAQAQASVSIAFRISARASPP